MEGSFLGGSDIDSSKSEIALTQTGTFKQMGNNRPAATARAAAAVAMTASCQIMKAVIQMTIRSRVKHRMQ